MGDELGQGSQARRVRGKGRGRPSRREVFRRLADAEAEAFAASVPSEALPPAQVAAPASDTGMATKAEVAQQLAIPNQVLVDSLGQICNVLPSHPLSKIVSDHAELAVVPSLAQKEEFGRVSEFGAKFWGDESRPLSSSSLAVCSTVYGEPAKWVRRAERRMAAAAELGERSASVQAQADTTVVLAM